MLGPDQPPPPGTRPMLPIILGLGLIAQGPPAGPAEQLRRLDAEHAAAWGAFQKANAEAKTDEQVAALSRMPGCQPRLYADRYMALATANPGTPMAEEALVWVGAHVMFGPETEEAKRLLLRDHVTSPRLAPVLAFQVLTVGSAATERLYRAVAADNPDRALRARAHYWLARFLVDRAEASRQLSRGTRTTVPAAPLIVAGWGADFEDRLRRLDPAALDAEAGWEFERAERDGTDVPHDDKLRPPGTVATAAAGYLRELRELAVGKPGPSTEGEDLDGRPFRLRDERGKVVVLVFGNHFTCGSCREMYPHERELVRRYGGRPFALVAVDGSPDRAALKDAWAAEGNTWRCLWDRSWDGPIATLWNIQVNPTVYVLDPAGVIRYKATVDPGAELDRVVADLIAAAEAGPAPR